MATGYALNCPQASIVERYIIEETIELCSGYMLRCEPIGVSKSRLEGSCEGKCTWIVKIKNVSKKEVEQAHLYILNDID